jgi:DNA repair exonuclease SbcCD ATPase subunit
MRFLFVSQSAPGNSMTRLSIGRKGGAWAAADKLIEKEAAQADRGEVEKLKTGTAPFAKSMSDFRNSFTELSEKALVNCVSAIDPSGGQAEAALNALGPVFESFTRNITLLAEKLSDEDIESNRLSLKAQASVNKVKLEATRTASTVQMQNQAAEMEASFNTTLQQKVEQQKAGTGQELKEAHEKAATLQKELESAIRDRERLEGMNHALNGILRSKEAESARAIEDYARLEALQASNLEKVREAKEEARQLRYGMAEASAAVERASMQSEKESKAQVAAIARKLKKEVAAVERGSGETVEGQVQRLLTEMHSISKAHAEKERQLETSDQQLIKVKAQLAELQSAVEHGEFQRALIQAQAESTRLKNELTDTSVKLDRSEGDLSQEKQEAARLRRDIEEKMTKVMTEAQQAAVQSAEECKRQVEAMAQRLGLELAKVRRGEREEAEKQFSRILADLAEVSQKLTGTETKLQRAQEMGAMSEMLLQRINRMEAEEHALKGKLAKAMGDLEGQAGHNFQLSDQLNQLLSHYGELKSEFGRVRATLDGALRELSVTFSENNRLSDKLDQLLAEHHANRVEAYNLRGTLDTAIADVALTVGENANLSDKLRQLLAEYRRMSENEVAMRTALKRQNRSLHAAFLRVRDVEVELQRANMAGAAQREELVSTALFALSSLRSRLGSVHAIRPDASRVAAIDEAITVKQLAKSQSAGSFSFRAHGPQSFSPPSRYEARPDFSRDGLMETPGFSPRSGQQSIISPVSPYWSQGLSRPSPPEKSARFRELSPIPNGKPGAFRVPQPGSNHRSAHNLIAQISTDRSGVFPPPPMHSPH